MVKRKMKTAEVLKTTQRGCPECSKVGDDINPEPLYECGSCGNEFARSNSADGGSHRCPQCNKFGSKISDEACPDCNVELEDLDTYIYKDKTYTDEDSLIRAIKDIGEALPLSLQEVDMKHQEEKQRAETERKQRDLKRIAEQKEHKEFKTIEEVEQAFRDFLNAMQSPMLKLIQRENSNWNREYVERDKDGNIRWHLSFESVFRNDDKYIDAESHPINKAKQFYEDADENGIRYMGMKPDFNNTGSTGWFLN
jgi:DNA-directed RNA polymerase subunit RPC12/RpoP